MAQINMHLAELLTYLDRLAQQSLVLWEMPPNASVALINVSENATYLVNAEGGYKAVLRIHREHYHCRRAIECELLWIAALKEERSVFVPISYYGKNGEVVQEGRVAGLKNPRYMVLFEYIPGQQLNKDGSLEADFEELGWIAAHTHEHAKTWQYPYNFKRMVWNVDTILGPLANWGDWRYAPNVTANIREVLDRVECRVRKRLDDFGMGADRYGLIHADMRLANLLKSETGTHLIDFDDCGMGWFLYDFATAISFIEDDPRVSSLKAAWLRGYEKLCKLSAMEKAELDTFVIMRRLALLAWIGSHIETPEAQELSADFASVTAELGAAWLKSTPINFGG